jgi:tetratricopeptide (TPR) repeat protein
VDELQREKQGVELILAAEGSMNEGDLDKAMECMDKALEINPQDGSAMMTKARIFKRQATEPGQPDKEKLLNKAVVLADQAISLLPGKAEPIYNKACYQALLGSSKDDVLANLGSAFRLNPALRGIARDDADLKSLSQDADFVKLTGKEPVA